jgi:hypothetical protein
MCQPQGPMRAHSMRTVGPAGPMDDGTDARAGLRAHRGARHWTGGSVGRLVCVQLRVSEDRDCNAQQLVLL